MATLSTLPAAFPAPAPTGGRTLGGASVQDPLIKASYFAGNLKGLDVLGADGERAARAKLTAILKGFDGLSRLDWVPLAWDIELTRVALEIGGLPAVRALNKRSMLLSLDGPLVRPFVSTAVSLFGPTPRSLFRFLPRAWAASTKDMGTIELPHLDEHSATLAFVGLPRAALGDAAWLDGFNGLIEGIYETTRHVGTAPAARVVDGQALYDVSWKKP